MAKEKVNLIRGVKMAKEKVNLYLLAIVAIVAVVGIVVLVMNARTTYVTYDSADDLSGQVARVSSARMPIASCSGPGEAMCGASCCNYYTHDCINLRCTLR
jgi:hypothetical protein